METKRFEEILPVATAKDVLVKMPQDMLEKLATDPVIVAMTPVAATRLTEFIVVVVTVDVFKFAMVAVLEVNVEVYWLEETLPEEKKIVDATMFVAFNALLVNVEALRLAMLAEGANKFEE